MWNPLKKDPSQTNRCENTECNLHLEQDKLNKELELKEREILDLKDKIRKLRESLEEPTCTTYLYEQLAEKDKQIRELTLSFKDFSYNIETQVRKLAHVADITNFEKSEIYKIKEENKFLKSLMKDHYESVQKGEDWRGVFTEEVVKRLNE
jgi:predicted RNase H-like nuclease (RuvC/YqgF family)